MARKPHHEEHANHEAWAIPYGDLITLLLAFFVVMYAVSSVNEGKYRVLSDSLTAAFRGAPRSASPIQVGNQVMRAPQNGSQTGMDPMQAVTIPEKDATDRQEDGGGKTLTIPLQEMAEEMERAMEALIAEELITVNRNGLWVEVAIKADILFDSGSAEIQTEAEAILADVARILEPLPNTIRVEGHTDTRPINTPRFPSNWELSAARAARIVRQFEGLGIDPTRMVIAGMGEHQPVAGNETVEGRNRNRRVTLVVLDALPSDPTGERTSLVVGSVTEPSPEPGEGV